VDKRTLRQIVREKRAAYDLHHRLEVDEWRRATFSDRVRGFATAEVDRLLSSAQSHGFTSRFRDMEELARTARLIALVHGSSATLVDIALGAMHLRKR
jgi:hypothetical protein